MHKQGKFEHISGSGPTPAAVRDDTGKFEYISGSGPIPAAVRDDTGKFEYISGSGPTPPAVRDDAGNILSVDPRLLLSVMILVSLNIYLAVDPHLQSCSCP